MFKKMNKCMGVGINYRTEIAADILTHRDKVDFIEINTERFFVGEPNSAIKEIIDTIPVIFHGLTLSIGTSNQATHKSYLENLAKTLGEIDCLWFSEHIAITNVNGFELRALAPVEFTPESVENIVAKAKQIQALTPKQFLLENIAYYYQMPTDVKKFFLCLNISVKKP